MKHTITLIPGDGIGPEVASNVVRIIEAAGVDVTWETHYAGAQALEKFGTTLPEELLASITRNKSPSSLSHRSVKVRLSQCRCARPSTSTPTCDRCAR